MKIKPNNQAPSILVLDLELNQPSEKVIELGYVIGNLLTSEIYLRRSILVDPKETISPEIVELTGISQSMIDGATSLDAAYEAMVYDVKKFSALPLIHQWGVPDAQILQKQVSSSWIFGRRWVDVKALAQTHAIVNGKKIYGGLKKMAGRIGIEVSGKEAHRADYDAAMTFLVHARLSRCFLNFGPNKSLKPSYRHIYSVLYNFIHSFISKTNVRNLLKEQLQHHQAFELQIIPEVINEGNCSEALANAIFEHSKKLAELLLKSQSSIELLTEVKIELSQAGELFQLVARAIDDRGRVHQVKVCDSVS